MLESLKIALLKTVDPNGSPKELFPLNVTNPVIVVAVNIALELLNVALPFMTAPKFVIPELLLNVTLPVIVPL